MPFVPSSGPLSLNTIKSVMGGPASPSLANYYRGGAYVPSTKSTTTTVRDPTSGEYFSRSSSSYSSWYVSSFGYNPGGSDGYIYIYWFKNLGTGAGIGFSPGNGNFSSATSGGVTYFRGSHRVFEYDSTYATSQNWFGIYRQYQDTVTVNINTSVPTSGQISISQFYGAEKP